MVVWGGESYICICDIKSQKFFFQNVFLEIYYSGSFEIISDDTYIAFP